MNDLTMAYAALFAVAAAIVAIGYLFSRFYCWLVLKLAVLSEVKVAHLKHWCSSCQDGVFYVNGKCEKCEVKA